MIVFGTLEKPLVFDGNDRPGVMLAGAAQTYLNRFGVRVGNRAVVATSHDSAWYAAAYADAMADDDVRSIYVRISDEPAGVALVSFAPDQEPRFLFPLLERSLGVPVRGWMALPEGRYIRLGAGPDAGLAGTEAEARAREWAVRRLTELHGGSVSARSEGPGCGSEFIVRLPLATAREEARRAPAPGARKPLQQRDEV